MTDIQTEKTDETPADQVTVTICHGATRCTVSAVGDAKKVLAVLASVLETLGVPAGDA